MTRPRRWPKTIARQSAPTLAIGGKRAFYAQIERPLDEAYALASVAMIDNLAEGDSVEGIGAFLEGGAPSGEETPAIDGGGGERSRGSSVNPSHTELNPSKIAWICLVLIGVRISELFQWVTAKAK